MPRVAPSMAIATVDPEATSWPRWARGREHRVRWPVHNPCKRDGPASIWTGVERPPRAVVPRFEVDPSAWIRVPATRGETAMAEFPIPATVIGSWSFPGWYEAFIADVAAHPERFGPVDREE